MDITIIAWIVLAAVVGLLALGYFYARSMDNDRGEICQVRLSNESHTVVVARSDFVRGVGCGF